MDSDAQHLTAVDLQTIEIQGYLKKQGPSAMSGWKTRYCILHSNGRLRYFEDESMDRECNDVMLSEIMDVKREKNRVVVNTTQREWRFEAEDDSEALLWSKHFKRLKRTIKKNDHFGLACEGWLQKQGGTVKSWKRRWCTLHNDGTFRYYSDETLKDQKKQDVCLSEINDVGEDGDEFFVRTANREWRFRTDDEDDRAVWIENFRNFLVENAGINPDYNLPAGSMLDVHSLSSTPSNDTLSSNIAAAHALVHQGSRVLDTSNSMANSGDNFEEMCKQKSDMMLKQKKKTMFGLF